MSTELKGAGLLGKIRWFRWAMAHAGDLKPLLDVPAQFREAATYVEKGEVMIRVIQVVTPILDDLATVEAAGATDVSALQVEVEALGFDWGKLLELLALIIEWLGPILSRGE